MALLCTCNIVAIGNLFFSLRTSKVLPVFLFLASGSAAVAVAMGAGAGGAGAEHGTDIQRRERRERGGEETAFLSEIGTDEMEGRREGGREERKRQKAAAPEDVSWRLFSGNPRADSRITIIPLSGNAPRGNNWIPFAGSFA